MLTGLRVLSPPLLSCSPLNAPILSGSQCFHDLRPRYLANILLVGHKVMESEVNHVRARYNCQGLQQEGVLRVIQVKNLSELQGLQKKQNRWGWLEKDRKLYPEKPDPNTHIGPNSQQASQGLQNSLVQSSFPWLSLFFIFILESALLDPPWDKPW